MSEDREKLIKLKEYRRSDTTTTPILRNQINLGNNVSYNLLDCKND